MMEENESNTIGTIMNIIGVTCVALSVGGGYIAFDTYQNKYQLSKAQFICTKIEQVGKNMDDVICTQYTNQKYAKEAVALNKTIAAFEK
jgi:hypothetical protein